MAASTNSDPLSRERTLGSGRNRSYLKFPFARPAYSGFRWDALAILTSRSSDPSMSERSLMSVATTRLSWTKKTEA